MTLDVKKITEDDFDEVWTLIKKIITKGDTYVFSPETKKNQMLSYWCSKSNHTYIVQNDGKLVGTFLIKDNQPGLGSHIANAAFMTEPDETGKGVGRLMSEFALKEAKNLGYSAMQFNFVVKSNSRAIRLWKKLGFLVIGEVPEAFNHATEGLTNALIMYRKL